MGEALFLVGIQQPDRERTSQARGASPKTAMLGGPSQMEIKMELSGRAKPWGRAQVEGMLPHHLHARLINRCPRQGRVSRGNMFRVVDWTECSAQSIEANTGSYTGSSSGVLASA
jgi:hypothetical protein